MENIQRSYFTLVMDQINSIMTRSTMTNDKMFVEEISDPGNADLSKSNNVDLLENLADEMEQRENPNPYCLKCGERFCFDDGTDENFIDGVFEGDIEGYCKNCCDKIEQDEAEERLAYWRNPDPEDKYDI